MGAAAVTLIRRYVFTLKNKLCSVIASAKILEKIVKKMDMDSSFILLKYINCLESALNHAQEMNCQIPEKQLIQFNRDILKLAIFNEIDKGARGNIFKLVKEQNEKLNGLFLMTFQSLHDRPKYEDGRYINFPDNIQVDSYNFLQL